MIQNILSIIVALGVLITFHEFGHYYIARRCGIKVLRFSVGFGKPIYTFTNKLGTEFTLALIPLGGYVRMLDEREGLVDESLKSQAFNNKSVWQRISVVAAGPLANLLLAILLYSAVALQGIQTVSPIVGDILRDTPVATTNLKNGDELIEINGEKVNSWEDVHLALAGLIGNSGSVPIRYLKEKSTVIEESIKLNAWLSNSEPSSLITAFGLTVKQPSIPAVIHDLVEGGAAKLSNFQIADEVINVNDKNISDWREFVDIVQRSPQKTLNVTVKRDGEMRLLSLTPKGRNNNGVMQGYVGIAVAPIVFDESWYRTVQYGIFESIVYGASKTGQMIELTFGSIVKMLKGLISIDNLSGPITIAKVASASAESGLQSFIQFMAYLSISLGILNLLPIPVLDGGHLVFHFIEAIRGKPVSEKIQHLAYRIGGGLLFSLMAIAVFNDIARL